MPITTTKPGPAGRRSRACNWRRPAVSRTGRARRARHGRRVPQRRATTTTSSPPIRTKRAALDAGYHGQGLEANRRAVHGLHRAGRRVCRPSAASSARRARVLTRTSIRPTPPSARRSRHFRRGRSSPSLFTYRQRPPAIAAATGRSIAATTPTTSPTPTTGSPSDLTAHVRMPRRRGDVLEGVVMCAPVTDEEREADVVRFLEQASLGPTEALVAEVKAKGIAAWLDEQIPMNVTRYTQLSALDPPARPYAVHRRPLGAAYTPEKFCSTQSLARAPVSLGLLSPIAQRTRPVAPAHGACLASDLRTRGPRARLRQRGLPATAARSRPRHVREPSAPAIRCRRSSASFRTGSRTFRSTTASGPTRTSRAS